MRILHVVQPPKGGAPALVELLIQEQMLSHEVGVVCRPGLARRIATSGAHVWGLPMRREIAPLDDFVQLFRLVRIVRRFEPDVIHAHSSKAGALGRLAARAFRVPTVFSPHNFAHSIHEGTASMRRFFLLVERLLAPLTDQLHLTFESERVEALRLGLARPERVKVVPNGIDVESMLTVPPPSGEPPTVGTYARIWPQKRIDLLLRATRRLADGGHAFRIAVIGDGPVRLELQRLAADLGLADRARFVTDSADRAEALGELDVYVLSSSTEAFPMAPMEAMAAGRPVIATAVGALPEIVRDGKTGFLVPPGDEVALAGAIERLIVEPNLRKRFGENGRALARTSFGIAKMSTQLEDVYLAAVQCSSTSVGLSAWS